MHSIGLIETSSIAKGIEVGDAMAKTANVTILAAKTICPGKYIVMIGGEVAAVDAAVARGEAVGGATLVDKFVIANIHSSILPAISGVTSVDHMSALGILETYSVAAMVDSADAAVKAADVSCLRLHLAFGIGGKCYGLFTGDVAAVEAAVKVGAELAGSKGMLVQYVVIPRPHAEMVNHLL
ncbi:BMC domain-containing protein [Noviherbaspirillum saxi]|nr:BMC domain-containing protein [Noviherbaspirillum saxi]